MSNEKMLVHGHVWDPRRGNVFLKPNKSERCVLHTVRCSAADRCGLHERGECAMVGIRGARCPYGEYQRQEGLTGRARGYRAQIDGWEEMLARHGSPSLREGARKATVVGDFVWLPYDFMGVDGKGIRLFHRDDQFLPLSEFTAEWIVERCDYRPQAIFGGEIREYQTRVVPLFVAHLREGFPGLLADAARLSRRIREVLAALTRVGRKARLRTVAPNVGAFDGWTWDGEALRSGGPAKARKVWGLPTGVTAADVRVVPAEGAVVKIESDDQVGPETVFVD